MDKVFGIIRAILKTLRLALPKLGVGWMFALLTVNFNRVTIFELGVTAVLVTVMLSLHNFLSPFQVISGRIADRWPIFGYRRTPYLLLSAVLSSLLFLTLPSVAQGMGAGNPLAFLSGLVVFILFGVTIAILGDSHHSLIAEVVPSRSRGSVISVVWTFTILSTIIGAGIIKSVMPEYVPADMQRLYNLTPFIVIGSAVLGVVGIEKRLKGAELTAAIQQSKTAAPPGNPLKVIKQVLSQNKQARGFFAFVFISILAIFLQDNILEPFGGEVFGMSPGETASFQQMWGGGVLIGMILMGGLSAFFAISKRNIALVGCIGTALGMTLLSSAALLEMQTLVTPALVFMGFFTGFFNVGALSMMMDMTIEGATGLYMGLWGMAQAFGNGVASFGGGALHTGLIETRLLTPSTAYFTIFSLEALGMVIAAVILWHLSVKQFHQSAKLSRDDTVRAMEAGVLA